MSFAAPDNSTILLVDDQLTNLKILTSLLTKHGYRVRQARNGQSALNIARQTLPDLILLDIRIPDISGFEICRQLKNTEQTCNIPVIFLSVLEEIQNKINAFAAGGVDYITKPFQTEEVLARVRTHLSLRTMQKQLEEKNARLHQEIAERTRFEQALREERDKAQQYLNIAGVIILALNRHGAVTLINKKGCELLGYHEHDIVGKNWFEIFLPERRKYKVSHRFQLVMAGELDVFEYFENLVITRDGEERLIAWHNNLLKDDKGKIIGALSSGNDITLSRRAEEALRIEKEFSENILNALADTVFVFDPSTGKPLRWNNEISGYSDEEIASRKAPDSWYDANDFLRAQKTMKRLFQGGRGTVEMALMTKTGQTVPTEYSASLFKNTEHGSQYIIAVGRDITERKQTEKALRDSEKRFRSVFESSASGMILVEARHKKFVEVNQKACQFLGYTAEELLGKTYIEVTHPDDLAKTQSESKKLISRENDFFSLDKRYVTRDGRTVWANTNVAVIKNADDTVPLFIVQLIDITKRKHFENALQESEEKYHSLFEDANDSIFIVDPKTQQILDVNQNAVRRLGYTREELLRLTVKDIGKPKTASQKKEIARGLLGKGHLVFEHIHIHKDGTEIPVEISSRAIEYNGRKILQSIVRDISERKRTEKELQQAKEAAESANRAKSEFLANMSHEFRTPLNGILGYTQILKRASNLTHQQYKGIEIIQHSGEHLLTLINDILDLSKIEAGKLELAPVTFHLPNMLKRLVDMTRLRAEQKGLTFCYNKEPEVPSMVYGDERRLRQVLLNLLGNAVKFTGSGKITFRVGTYGCVCMTEEIARPNNGRIRKPIPAYTIRFQVEDTGIGISSEHLELIFSPFEQIKGNRRYSEGTGLGLAISQRLLRMMNSELHVTSRPKQGSTFWFDLNVPEITSVTESKEKFSQDIIGFHGKPRKILIVDDKDENRMMLKDMLLPVGFDVIEVSSGHEAVVKAKDVHPDLIFMDLIMPVMDGFEARRRIRQIPELNEVVIVAVSADAFEQTRQESVSAGFHDFLLKPMTQQKLFETLQTHLNIEWLYDGGAYEGHFRQPSPVSEPIIPPPMEELSRLHHLAIIGDIMGIREHIQNIETLDPQYTPFVEQIRQLAQNLHIVAIQQFLKFYIEGE